MEGWPNENYDKEHSPLQANVWSAIPSSDADSESGFPVLRKIHHTDQRSNLDHSTTVSLMSFKFFFFFSSTLMIFEICLVVVSCGCG